jgi:Histidine kinase-, DNA gyrase B-, and HSP90-like ATPase
MIPHVCVLALTPATTTRSNRGFALSPGAFWVIGVLTRPHSRQRWSRVPAALRSGLGLRPRFFGSSRLTPAGSICRTSDGPGLTDEQRAQVLASCKRLAESMPGPGLGLSIATKLATPHGGTLSLARSEMGGLTVSLDLPAAVAPPHLKELKTSISYAVSSVGAVSTWGFPSWGVSLGGAPPSLPRRTT